MITIKEKFIELQRKGKKAFIAYVPFGFPSLKLSKDIILTLQDAGVDIIELGIPFSDPIADGPIIQAATTQALNNGASSEKLFSVLNDCKNHIQVPVALMTYYNPVMQFGMSAFFKRMKQCGATATLIVDLPVDESKEYLAAAHAYGIETVFFVTPVTPVQRILKIVRVSKGFIYYISVTGTTGLRNIDYSKLRKHIESIKSRSLVPVCVGFGIHTREQVKELGRFCDGVIVGSDIVRFISAHYRTKGFLAMLKRYVRGLAG